MALNWEVIGTHYFVDQENKMMLNKNFSYDKEGDEGRGDAIGRTFKAYFCYGDPRFLEGIEDCWVKVNRKYWFARLLFGKWYWQGYRYPTHDQPVGLSRDHLLNTILAFIYAGYSETFVKEFVKHLRWRISKDARFTIDLWL